MPVIRLGQMKYRSLDGDPVTVTAAIERETHKAILLTFDKGAGPIGYWFPKSQIEIRERKRIKIIDGAPIETDEIIDEIHIPDWLWEKREEAKPMGV